MKNQRMHGNEGGRGTVNEMEVDIAEAHAASRSTCAHTRARTTKTKNIYCAIHSLETCLSTNFVPVFFAGKSSGITAVVTGLIPAGMNHIFPIPVIQAFIYFFLSHERLAS